MTSNYWQKNEKELETLIHAVKRYSQDIGTEFDIEKRPQLVMKSGKRHITNEMEKTNQERLLRSEKTKLPHTRAS